MSYTDEDIATKKLTGKQKVAALLMSLDVDVAARVFQKMDVKEVESIATEISKLKGIDQEVIDMVLAEFYQLMSTSGAYVEGGIGYAQSLLERTYGPERAKELTDKIKLMSNVKNFSILKKADPEQLANFLKKEHPQTVALILSHLDPDQSAAVLNEFDDELKTETVYRIATLGKVSPESLGRVESVLDEIAASTLTQSVASAGGSKMLANILNKVNNQVAKQMIENLEQQDPKIATEVKRLMFLFEDIILIDDRGIQRLLREIDKRDLALAMKISSDDIKDKIFRNMSERAADVVKEELEFMGPVKLKEVEDAQTRIVDKIKELEEKEEIVVGGRGNDDVFV
jgi:flagellar motor switch protein FliG